MPIEVIVPRAVRPLIDQLAGQRAGYGEVYAQLERDPCATHLGAYRLAVDFPRFGGRGGI